MSIEYINETSFSKEMRFGFGEYAKYVISDRALPDARDGLKPVHRRILWAMHELGLGPRSAFKKCARIVGETTGRYHPHAGGVYESLVRLAQDWSLRYPLVDPQGNFGSIDGYPPAAMRYTEARLARISLELMENISPNIVEFIPNFDGEEEEPTVLPVKVPHLLLNGSYGIAVGISSNIPPHNLTELMNACIAIIDDPGIPISDLMKLVKGPDFPTGGIVVGTRGIEALYSTGKGSLRIRSKSHFESPSTHKVREPMIVIDEIPYLQNKASIIEHIASLIDNDKLRGVVDVRDLSKDKIRIEIPLQSQYTDEIGVKTVLGQLYKSTNLETLFHARINAFVYGQPKRLDLKQSLCVFLDFREHCVKAIAQEELEKVNARLHILEGLIIASDHIDDIIKLIRASESRSAAQSALMNNYSLSDEQAKAVLDMTLGRLARMEQDSLKQEAEERRKRKAELEELINNRSVLLNHMKKEFEDVISKNQDSRRTFIQEVDDIRRPGERPLLHQRNLLVTSTNEGYVRAIEYNTFKSQSRGGKGVAGVPLDGENETLYDMLVLSNLDDVLLITTEGIVHRFPAYDIPEVRNRTARGPRLKRYIPIEASVVKVVPVEHDKFNSGIILVTVTKHGMIKRTSLDKYKHIRKTGIKCLNFKDDTDEVVDAFVTHNDSFIFIATKNGQACVFDETQARLMGRVSQGVIGIKVATGDEVVSSFAIQKSELDITSIMTVSEKGYGKRTPLNQYRITNRGAKGVINQKINAKTGKVVTSMPVPLEAGDSTISLVNSLGTLIKVKVEGIRNMGRSTQGVKVMRIKGKQKLIKASQVSDEGEEFTEEDEMPDTTPIQTSNEDDEEVINNPRFEEDEDEFDEDEEEEDDDYDEADNESDDNEDDDEN